MSAGAKYLGMGILQALAAAHAAGEQLRVLSNNTIQMRYADEALPEHIQVKVTNGVITWTN